MARAEADANKRVLCCDWLDNKSLTSLYVSGCPLVRRCSSEVSYWFMQYLGSLQRSLLVVSVLDRRSVLSVSQSLSVCQWES